MNTFVALDFETTNRYPSSVYSIGLVFVEDSQITDTYYRLIKPYPNFYNYFNTLIHGIARSDRDSLGGVVSCVVKGVSAGIGNPIFNKLSSRLAAAMMSIPSAKGFDYGAGFEAAAMRGSEHNDIFVADSDGISTATNRSGGIQGGISNGEDIYFRVAFKPVASIGKQQQTVDTHGNARTIEIRGRHDVCIVPRVVPVVESLAALVILDLML